MKTGGGLNDGKWSFPKVDDLLGKADSTLDEAQRQELVHDMPGGEERFIQTARGIKWTLVNGQVLLEERSHTGQFPGLVLRNPRAAATRR